MKHAILAYIRRFFGRTPKEREEAGRLAKVLEIQECAAVIKTGNLICDGCLRQFAAGEVIEYAGLELCPACKLEADTIHLATRVECERAALLAAAGLTLAEFRAAVAELERAKS